MDLSIKLYGLAADLKQHYLGFINLLYQFYITQNKKKNKIKKNDLKNY